LDKKEVGAPGDFENMRADELAVATTTGSMVKKAIPQANNHSYTNRILKPVN
jgi:hypothetical protein